VGRSQVAGQSAAGLIDENRKLGGECRLMTIVVPADFPEPVPGQFVHLRLTEGLDPLLRRPFSVCGFEKSRGAGRIALLYQVVGRGTRMMASMKKVDHVDVLGPLGNGYSVPANFTRHVLVAGGTGVASLIYLLKTLTGKRGCAAKKNVSFIFGAATDARLYGLEMLKKAPCATMLCTEDGSRGTKGTVLAGLDGVLAGCGGTGAVQVYACGPMGMLRAVAGACAKNKLSLQVSLESHMACGTGMCRGCVQMVHQDDGTDAYATVCHDGPVFDARKVCW
jgi:dihydroorotate dehydrogenase electron transfer subunit